MKIAFIEKYKNKIGLRFNSPLRKGPVRDYVFIHINKTAGTSIVHIIGKPFRKHLTAKEVSSPPSAAGNGILRTSSRSCAIPGTRWFPTTSTG